MSFGFGKCEVCGTTLHLDLGFGNRNNWKTKDNKVCCSEKCCNEYNKSLLYKKTNQDNTSRNSQPEHETTESVDENEKLFDGVKKLLFHKKNKEVKDKHKKLQEIESDIILSLSKNDKDKSIHLIKQLELDSKFFVPNTTISYKEYWENKRREFLERI
jgi:hypothetical protein